MTDLRNLDWLTSDQAAAIRELQDKKDRFGLALMMIREGCEDPRGVAANALTQETKEG